MFHLLVVDALARDHQQTLTSQAEVARLVRQIRNTRRGRRAVTNPPALSAASPSAEPAAAAVAAPDPKQPVAA
jgi:hypothetical protein